MRGRNALCDLNAAVTLTGFSVAVSYLYTVRIGGSVRYSRPLEGGGDLLVQWAICSTAIAGILAAMLASILGAAAMPSSAEFASVQSSLLTRLKPMDICAGRLVSGLWVPITTILLSMVFWLCANLAAARFGGAPQFGAVFAAHLAVLMFACWLGTIGFLCSVKRRPGSNPVSGFAAALAIGAVCVSAIWLVNPIIGRMDSPEKLIEAALVINPAVDIASAYKIDIVREEWVYNQLRAPEYPFLYPSVSTSCILFLVAGCSAISFSGAALRRAYR